MKANSTFWTQLETKQISKEQIESHLITKLGTPNNPTQTNLLQEITNKINSYYFAIEIQNTTVFSLIGKVEKAIDIVEKQRKKGKKRGQTFYVLKIACKEGKEQLQAYQEDLEPAKWQKIQQLAILNQNLVFKWKKWIVNKQIVDFYPASKNLAKAKVKPKQNLSKINE